MQARERSERSGRVWQGDLEKRPPGYCPRPKPSLFLPLAVSDLHSPARTWIKAQAPMSRRAESAELPILGVWKAYSD